MPEEDLDELRRKIAELEDSVRQHENVIQDFQQVMFQLSSDFRALHLSVNAVEDRHRRLNSQLDTISRTIVNLFGRIQKLEEDGQS